MQIVSIFPSGDSLHEMSSPVFAEKEMGAGGTRRKSSIGGLLNLLSAEGYHVYLS